MKLGNNPNDSLRNKGKNALEIVNTLIEKVYFYLQHAGDMGIELHKAEMALKLNLKYVQDKELLVDK